MRYAPLKNEDCPLSAGLLFCIRRTLFVIEMLLRKLQYHKVRRKQPFDESCKNLTVLPEMLGSTRKTGVEKPVENVYNFFVNNVTVVFYVKYKGRRCRKRIKTT